MNHYWYLLSVGLLALAVGCGERGKESGNGKSGDTQQPDPSTPKRVEMERLQFDESRLAANRDGGRVDFLPPKEWRVGPPESDYIVWFQLHKSIQIPRILISAEEIDQFETVTEDNLEEFVASIKEELGDAKLLEPVRPMIIGDRPCARYVKGAQFRGGRIERQILVTHVNGRRYTVDMQVKADTILKHRDAGYAALAGMQFKMGPAQPMDDSGDKSGEQADPNDN